MKKLLNLLSILTISGSVMPTTIAASPYQKQETIKNIVINYQQRHNLDNLKRFKRDNENMLTLTIQQKEFLNNIRQLNNWDLSKKEGFFKFLAFCSAYYHELKKYYKKPDPDYSSIQRVDALQDENTITNIANLWINLNDGTSIGQPNSVNGELNFFKDSEQNEIGKIIIVNSNNNSKDNLGSSCKEIIHITSSEFENPYDLEQEHTTGSFEEWITTSTTLTTSKEVAIEMGTEAETKTEISGSEKIKFAKFTLGSSLSFKSSLKFQKGNSHNIQNQRKVVYQPQKIKVPGHKKCKVLNISCMDKKMKDVKLYKALSEDNRLLYYFTKNNVNFNNSPLTSEKTITNILTEMNWDYWLGKKFLNTDNSKINTFIKRIENIFYVPFFDIESYNNGNIEISYSFSKITFTLNDL